MSYEKIISSFLDKLILEINKPYFKEKINIQLIKPILEIIIKKCIPYIILLFILYIILIILLIVIISFLIYKKKK
tara:strand:+ start:301 stop:525 length:225 start_codon:yes stop_codon:yes gene_type:complete